MSERKIFPFKPKYGGALMAIISPEQLKAFGGQPFSDVPEYEVRVPDDHDSILHADGSETGFTLADLRLEENFDRLLEGKDPANRPPGWKQGFYKPPASGGIKV